jgi:membrane fusion protein (multidrug efflux system)
MPAAEAALVRGSVGKEGAEKGVAVAVIGADGKELPHRAKFTFIDTAIAQNSGMVQARATFPNTDRSVLPGQFVRARIMGVALPVTAIVPARSVMRSAMGAMVLVVGEGDVVQPRPVQLGDTFGNEIAVLSGVKAGERVIADGVFKVDLEKLFNPQNKDPVTVKAVPSTHGDARQPPASAPQPGEPPQAESQPAEPAAGG